jgi:hypothetical protein
VTGRIVRKDIGRNRFSRFWKRRLTFVWWWIWLLKASVLVVGLRGREVVGLAHESHWRGFLSLGKLVIPPEEELTWLGDPNPDLLFIPGEVEADRSTITLLVYMAHRLELKARLEMTWPVQARTARA